MKSLSRIWKWGWKYPLKFQIGGEPTLFTSNPWGALVFSKICSQGLYSSWKTGKVIDFEMIVSRLGKVMEFLSLVKNQDLCQLLKTCTTWACVWVLYWGNGRGPGSVPLLVKDCDLSCFVQPVDTILFCSSALVLSSVCFEAMKCLLAWPLPLSYSDTQIAQTCCQFWTAGQLD